MKSDLAAVQIQSCRFIPVSSMSHLPEYDAFMEGLSNSGQMTFGDMNRSLVTPERIAEYAAEGTKIREFIDNIPTNVYVDLEN